MSGKHARGHGQPKQDIHARGDAYTAGRDQTIIMDSGAAEQLVAPGLLPRDPPGFTGRGNELACLEGLAGGGSVVVAAIEGTPGVGKTALAIHAAHTLLHAFPDGHLYFDMRGFTEGHDPADPGEVLPVFLRRLGILGDALPADLEQQSGLFRQLLSTRRIQVILDNVATEGQLRPLLPGAGSSLVLITTRATLAGLELDERIILDMLPDDDAIQLLKTLVTERRAAAEPGAVQQIADLCGCLPLALRITGQLLAAHPEWEIAKLAGLLANEQRRLSILAAGDLQVRAAFMVSYQALSAADARMFRLLSLHPGPEFDTDAAANIAAIEPDTAESILERLAQAHLLAELGHDRFGMHDLLRLFARELCQTEDGDDIRDEALARIVDYYLGDADLINAELDPRLRAEAEVEGSALRDDPMRLRAVLYMFEIDRRNLLDVLDLTIQKGWLEKTWQLSQRMEGPLRRLRYLDELVAVSQAGLGAAKATGDKTAEASCWGNLGGAYMLRRQFEEATACFQNALTIFRETGERLNEGVTLTSLGEAYRFLRRFEEAITQHQAALVIFREIDDPHGEGQALINLGVAYSELGRFEEAIPCYEQDLAICRATRNRHGEGQTLTNLGNVYRNLRRFEEAISYHQDALLIFPETGDWHGQGLVLASLGSTYSELRRFEEAISCYQDALAIFQETGDLHGEGQVLTSLANAYSKTGMFKKAITCYQNALALFRESDDLHDQGDPLVNLGTAYSQLRRFEEAITCYQDALMIYRQTDDLHSQGDSLFALGNVYSQLRRFEEAITCYQDALAIYRETGDRRGEGNTLANGGICYARLRRFEEAAVFWLAAVEALREVGDHDTAKYFERAAKVQARRAQRPWRRRH